MKTADSQGGPDTKMDSCLGCDKVNAMQEAACALRQRMTSTNGRSFFNMGAIYSGMDLANLNAYGMIPDAWGFRSCPPRCFTVDLERGTGRPAIGEIRLLWDLPLLEQNGVDVEAHGLFISQSWMDEAEKAR